MGIHRTSLIVKFWPILMLCFGNVAHGISMGIYGFGGVMQVPASQHYAASYGGSVDFTNGRRDVSLRLSYLERPVHAGQGFVDQDMIGSLTLGSRVAGKKNRGLRAFLGYGVASGYVQAQDNNFDQELYGADEASYQIEGLDFQVDVFSAWGDFEVGLTHRMFVGLPNSQQLAANVAYPYSSYALFLGYVY